MRTRTRSRHRRAALALAAVVVMSSPGNPSGPPGFPLVEGGRSAYTIVLGTQASPSERHAAAELQHFVRLATGAELPVVTEPEPAAGPRIVVGRGALCERLLAGGSPVDWARLEADHEGFVLRTVAGPGSTPEVVIAGARQRGTLYGVYTFLDRLGFRWYTSRRTWCPRETAAGGQPDLPNQVDGTLYADCLDTVVVPRFLYREPYFDEVFDPDYAARNRLNLGHSLRLDEAHGGSSGVRGVHTFGTLIPDSLFATHPEYFPLIGGQRVTGYVQRCLTAPGIVELTAENMVRWMAREPDGRIFCLSQADVHGKLCECPACVRVMQAEGSPAGLYLDFVNRVAEIVERTYPDNYVSTLAYHFTEEPPRTVRPRRNVIVRLAPIDIEVAHPFTQSTQEAAIRLRQRLAGWSRLTDRLFVWCYVTDFENYLMPFPNFGEMTADVRNYYEHGVKGMFLEGCAATPGSPDNDLRGWVLARLLWDPYADAGALVDEWMHAVYGAAYGPMRAYFDLIHSRVADPSCHLQIFDPVTRRLWPPEVVSRLDSLYDQAQSLAQGNSTAAHYVAKNRMGVEFLKIITRTGRLEMADGEYRPVGNAVTLADYESFIRYIDGFGARDIGNTWSSHRLRRSLRQRLETHPVVTLENEALRLDLVPALGGRVVRIVHKASGRNLLYEPSPEENFYPVIGGYEESNARTWGCVGFAEPYEASRGPGSVTLTARTERGLTLTRTISLPDQSARIAITSAIRNTGDRPTTFEVACRMHLAGDPQTVELTGMTATGSRSVPMPSEVKQRRGRTTRRYDGPNKPVGEWSLASLPGGLTVQSTFAPEQVASCVLYSTDESPGMVLMELHAPERQVPPGGEVSLSHEWGITGPGHRVPTGGR